MLLTPYYNRFPVTVKMIQFQTITLSGNIIIKYYMVVYKIVHVVLL